MYELPTLPYLYQDLEPYIDTHTMGLHYHKHEMNYLNRLNELLIKNCYDYRYSLGELVYHINEFPKEDGEDILYNLGGVLNHNLYWKSMSKKGLGPYGKLKNAIDRTFGNLEHFFKEFKNTAMKLKGSGYTFLVLKQDGNLEIMNMKNQDTPLMLGYVPLLNMDLWEHAYYLNYEYDKGKYIDNFIIIMDFSNASEIYNNIMK